MTPTEQERMIKEYLDAVLDAFQAKAIAYYSAPDLDTKERHRRVKQIKDSLKGIGRHDTFGIAPETDGMDYSRCPSGVCSGGVCSGLFAFGDIELRQLAKALDVEPM
jgi:hypothetical protein